MKKKIIGFIILTALVIKIVQVVQENYIKDVMITTEVSKIEDAFYNKYEKMVVEAVKRHLQHGKLIYSNENIRTKVQILYIEYLIRNNDEIGFKKSLEEVINTFRTDEGLIAVGGYITKENNNIEVVPKASLKDNLKIYKLAVSAYNLWGDAQYKEIASQIGAKLYTYNVEGDKLYSYYDGERQDDLDHEIALADIDLKAIALLSEQDPRWCEVFDRSKEIIQEGYISSRFPLYEPYYSYEQGKYNKVDKINIQESLLIVKNLSESGICKEETIKWLKEQIKSGGVYEQYDKESGRVSSHKENLSIYALIGQIGKNIGDIELYTLAMEKMLSFQIKDETDEYFGVFMNKKTNELDDYDMMQALLAF